MIIKKAHGNQGNKYAKKAAPAKSWIQIRIEDKEKIRWTKLAAKKGDGSLSGWIKTIIREHIKPEKQKLIHIRKNPSI